LLTEISYFQAYVRQLRLSRSLSVFALQSQFKGNLYQTLRTGNPRPREELIKLWKLSVSGSGSRVFFDIG